MVITDFLERNSRLYGQDTALVVVSPSEKRDQAVTWREASLIESATDSPYRREINWRTFDQMANRFANLLLSREVPRGTKVGILMMNCLEYLPIYFGVLKAGCIVVPMNYRYSSDEIKYCLDLADVEILVFGPEFTARMDAIADDIPKVRTMFYVGNNGPIYTENCMKVMGFTSTEAPPISLNEDDYAAIYFSSGTTGFPKAILHKHRALYSSCLTEQNHHGQTKDDVFLCIPPLYHTGAKMHWFGSLMTGGKAVILRGIKPEWILRTVTEEKCTIVWLLVPWVQDILDAIDSGRIKLDDYLLNQWRLMHVG
ncbi:MAG: acyl--CoA ligase, partial [Spirochaetales bacterium]|nr:acyl--CoA ligase [Spirochaetales bacterium]